MKTELHDESHSNIVSSQDLKHLKDFEQSEWKTVLSNEKEKQASEFNFNDNEKPVNLPLKSFMVTSRLPIKSINPKFKTSQDASRNNKVKNHKRTKGKLRRLKKGNKLKSSRLNLMNSNARQHFFQLFNLKRFNENAEHEFTKNLENEIIQSHFSTSLINLASHNGNNKVVDSVLKPTDNSVSKQTTKNYNDDTLNTVSESSVTGDLSCMEGIFFPAPFIPHAQIKYIKSSKPGQEYLEADYQCVPGYVLFLNISKLLCKNRTWMGELPSCTIDKSLDLCYHSSCDQICNEVNGKENCSCYQGFQLQNDKCFDVDECKNNNGNCQYICVNTPGSFYCDCPVGMKHGDDSFTCIDIDECLLNNGRGPCQDTCQNYIGGYECLCSGLPGTVLSGDNHTCQDVGPCGVENAGCSHTCLSTNGRIFCLCPVGFMLRDDWKTCQDIDECSVPDLQTQVCQFGCINTPGSYRCVDPIELNDHKIDNLLSDACPPGYQALSSRSSCIDINECENNNGGCTEVCENTNGNYFCACEGDEKILSSDGKSCTDINSISCPPLLSTIKKGNLICSRPNMRNVWSPNQVVNRPGTKCYLKCSKDYQLVGEYQITCNADGNWIGAKTGECLKLMKPRIECPKDIITELSPGHDETFVKFEQPSTDLDWFRYVRSTPSWGMRLEAYLKSGLHTINFYATDPISKIQASCMVRIIVKDGDSPKVHNCPEDIVGNNSTFITWKEPIFTDNVKVTRISSNESPGRTFDTGQWHIVYLAYDDAGWFNNCTFNIFIE
ncbi:hypothetical protein PV326_003356 [Microctonus aethiopoides]|nr:hypothetical protein PV326_003356 [Microctonus aethiopoides]